MRIILRQWSLVLAIALIFSFDASAKSSEVWANSKSHVYDCEGDRWYGRTKKGFFIEEVDAISRGYRVANNNRCSNAGRSAINDIPNQEGANNKV